jgi:cytochrome c oxidase assembly protein subunit 15
VSTLIEKLFGAHRIRLYATLSLVSQILIVVTGGAVRLTGSGLGCPTWPECEPGSLVNVPEQGIHGVIEFGNRLLTFLLLFISLATFITVMRLKKGNRKGLFWTSLWLGLGIVIQAVLGGITVLTGLNSWIVGAHFLVSMGLISVATFLFWYSRGRKVLPASRGLSRLSFGLVPVAATSVVIGVVLTGSGPHAGDSDTPRNGLDSEIWSHYHSYPGYILLALVCLQVFLRWRISGYESSKFALIYLFTVGSQAILGLSQTWLGLPLVLVGLHMLGASVLVSMTTYQALLNRAWSGIR